MKSRSRAQPAQASGAAEPLEAVEAFSARLRAFRDRQGEEALRDSYQAALDQLETLAQRLKEATAKPPRTIGPSAPEAESDKRRAQTILEEAGLDAAWAIYTAEATDGREEAIIADIVDRLVQYGSLSAKQIGFVRKLLRDIEGRDKPRGTTEPATQAVEADPRKAEAMLEEAGLGAAWAIYTDAASAHREEQIIKDIVQKLVQYGSLSEKQVNFVGKLLRDIERRAESETAHRAKQSAAPEPPHRALPLGPVVIARKPKRR